MPAFLPLLLLGVSLSVHHVSTAPTTAPTINPVFPINFPDPAILLYSGTTYAYSTNSDNLHVPIAIAPSGGQATTAMTKSKRALPRDALPTLPRWVAQDAHVWAPDVTRLDDGSFILYFSASSGRDPSKHCVGAAKGTSPEGPFEPLDGDEPFICDLARGGAIDPAGFADNDGKVYVAYKVDGNSLGGPGPCGNGDGQFATPIELQEVDAKDGYTKIGQPTILLDRTAADGPYIEGPSIARSVDATYALFFSSQCYNGPDYNVKYATATSVKGPYQRNDTALLKPGDMGLFSPGGASVNRDANRIVFHANEKYNDPAVRLMYISEISIRAGQVTLVNNQAIAVT